MGVREITATEAAKRRSASSAPAGPPSSGMLRDYAEGVASTFGNAFDFMNSYSGMADTPWIEPVKRPPVAGPAADRISEATAENPTRARVAGTGTGNAAMFLPATLAMGGASVPMALSSLAGGTGGALASDEVRRRGYGGLAQFGAGVLGDVAAGGLVRGAFALPGFIQSMTTPARAGQYVAPLNLGTETADDVAMAVDDAYRVGAEDVDKAWEMYRAVPTTAESSAEPFRQLAAAQKLETSLKPDELPAIARRIPNNLPDNMRADDVNKVLKTVSVTMRDDNVTDNAKRLAGQFRAVADDALDEIEAASATDQAAVKALKAARKASRDFAEAFPDDSSLFKAFLAKSAPDEAQAGMNQILRSKQATTEMEHVVNAIGGNRAAESGLRRSVVMNVLKETEEVAGAAPTSALRRLDAIEGPARKALGDSGFEHFRKLLAEQATANRERPWSVLGAMGRGNTLGSLIGAAAGSMVDGPTGFAVGGAIGHGISAIAHRVSPRAVRELAIRSLYDPQLYQKITRPLPQGVSAAEWASVMVGSLVRSGVITKEDAVKPKESPKGR